MDEAHIEPARHKLDVNAYHQMGDAGIFAEDDRIELIDGDLIDMAPIGQNHAAMVSALIELLVVASSGRAIVWPQNPIRLDRSSEPQPDLAILRRRADFYATGEPPGPADVLLLIEIADSLLSFDRNVKLPLYARAGIAEFWIVDLQRRVIEAYRLPSGASYREQTTHHPGEQLALARAPDIAITFS